MAGTGIRALGGEDPRRFGTYELLGRLAPGGMGRVYVARSTKDGALVAVKTLPAEGALSDTDRRRFAREVKLARRIDSAHTARVLDADAHAESPWMAIEYIPAPSLAELVRGAGKLPTRAVHWVAAGVAQALVVLHDAQIVHRDIKPQNVLLPRSGPRLIDFGISHANDMTRTQLTLGTIAFTSPEQARAEPSTRASDVYSLGATLFHTAVGRPPYPETSDTIRLLTLVQRGELDLGGLPNGLAGLIRPCLAADPRDRPEPAEVLRCALAELDRAPAPQPGAGRLPPRWTALIGEYEAQGRALAAGGGGVEAVTVDLRTRQVPPPGPTRVYTEKRGGTGRPSRPKSPTPPDRKPTRPPATKPPSTVGSAASGSSSSSGSAGSVFWTVMGLIVLVVMFWKPWEHMGSAGSTGGLSSGGSSSGRSSSTYGGGGVGALSGGGGGGGSGGAGHSFSPPPAPTPTPSLPSPSPTPVASRTPSAEDLAFSSVRAGDCLDGYANGYGGWSRAAPERVNCQAAHAYVQVRSVLGSGSCPSGPGLGGWWHAAADFSSVDLCVERQFRVGQCFLARSSGGRPGGANLLTLWNCGAGRVPREFSFLMQITAVLPASAGTRACPPDPGHYTYSWQVYEGRSILCTKVA
ncbi:MULTISPECIES: serine/threonine-protein kinase [unclassified Streptomyces]|uniref:serine/threonine-protein kinase n=1 Tax=unclassified Streptomyces TaxID=2593676 RepID=UPI00039A73E3|nr:MULTISPECIES: serine/threonine-protein kinase [unclassified Streptomyces]